MAPGQDDDRETELYRNSAEFFDIRYLQKDYEREVGRLVAFLSAVHPHAASLLDVACGTGRHLEFLSKGYEAEGLDLNQSLLDLAGERLGPVRLHCADMCDFDLGRRYDIVTCLFGSAAMAVTREKMGAAIQRMADHLADDGVLLIEPYLRPGVYREGEVVHNFRETPERKLSWMYVMHRRGNAAVWDIHWLVGKRDSSVVHFVEHEEYGLFDTQEWVDAMAAAGLQAITHPRGLHGYGAIVGRRRPWTEREADCLTDAFGT